MNKSQENLLSFIKGNPNLTSNEISVKTGIAFKTVANNITWLVGEKLIVREMVDKKFRYSVKSAKPEKIKKEKPIKKEKTVSEKNNPVEKGKRPRGGFLDAILKEVQKGDATIKSVNEEMAVQFPGRSEKTIKDAVSRFLNGKKRPLMIESYFNVKLHIGTIDGKKSFSIAK